MKSSAKLILIMVGLFCFCFISTFVLLSSQALAFEPLKTDMSTFDPLNQTYPTSGDTIKIGLFEPFSGPSAISGEIFTLTLGWVVHDINSQGGIMVDGKMKKIQVIRGDTQVKPDVAKRAAEKLALEDKVHVMMGTSGTHINLVGQQVADKYKIIYQNYGAYTDMLHDGKNFTPYAFRTCWTVNAATSGFAYYFSKRPEKKFYLLNQDYAYGHAFSEGFKNNLKKFKPEAQIVGEEFHQLFLADFAPYLTKVQGSGAEVLVSGDWATDEENMMKQSRELGMKIPLAGFFFDDSRPLQVIGPEAGKGFTLIFYHRHSVNTPKNNHFNEVWNAQWKKWKAPYNTDLYMWPAGVIGGTVIQYYWLFDVIKKAGSTNPEKIMKAWEGHKYESMTGVMEMRACDHQAVRDLYVSVLEHPNKWNPKIAADSESVIIPAKYATPPIAEDLERCKQK